MGSLFAPADAIIGRLSYTYKIVLTSVPFLVPVGYLVWASFDPIQGRMEKLGQESRGLKLIRATQEIFALVPRHRDLSRGVLNGNQRGLGGTRAN